MRRRRSGRSPSPHGSSCTFAIRQLYAGILRTTGRHSHTACVGVTERLGRASSRHPWRTILAWGVAIVVALALSAALLPGNLTTEGHVTGSPESARAERAFLSRLPPDRNAVDELVVVRSETLTSRDPAFRQFGARLLAQARATGVVHRERVLAVSKDRHAVLIGIQRKADVDDLLPVVERADGQDGFQVAMTGEGTLDHDFNEVSQHDLESGELKFGLPAALIILLLVFGAVVAGVIPLGMAFVAIVVALGLCAPIAAAFSLSVFFVNMLTGMGLALGIDYSLFVVSRYREERAGGLAELDSIAAASATASRAVLFSGSVFVIALTGMLLVPSNIMKSLAVAAIAVGIVSVLAALTLLPALLGLLGDRVNALRLPFVGRSIGSGGEGRFWGGVVRGVMRRPMIYLVAFSALLIALAIPTIGLNLGASGVSTLPDRLEAKQGYEALARDFPQASSSPALIEVGGDKTGDRALEAVRHLRDELIPQAFRGTNAEVLVGGDTADNVDYIDTMNAWLLPVFVFVLGLSFVLLTVAFRSIVVAATSMALNLLSVGAAYGLVVLVFRHGVGSGL